MSERPDSGAAVAPAAGVPASVATDPREAAALAETFRVLADPGRVRIILALAQAGELKVGDLAAAAGLSETACSHSLRLLRGGRVVARRKVGRSVLYSLDDDHVSGLLDLARAHVDHGRSPG